MQPGTIPATLPLSIGGTIVGQQIKGIQSNHIASAIKHFSVNAQETVRHTADARIDDASAPATTMSQPFPRPSKMLMRRFSEAMPSLRGQRMVRHRAPSHLPGTAPT